ncbi:diguanylate phosphodiesterase [Lactonifactor longoviformis]|uniref:Diguanylate cyclase (GGDEF) domain-containing protein n=1 Tax=Lactonifactor longoviformis DSM 17459 TaxID=1122155 RepID=A0A1M4WYQ6_9CLOT|nr:EAL domain-containing protein [Lactonifactor longoviformis]POP32193.1 diguanylate phosphodiesterase [Lactonifactor longoviformis]SHE86378.1 diguanylate cyclase (GGDEF) domain-containing protein [Lactonifactor longoviformis DSM 17459]
MEWNIAPEAISLVILVIIWVYSRSGSFLPTLKNRIFQWCLLVTFGAMLTNILSTIMIYHSDTVPIWLIWTVTTVYFIMTPLMGMAYFFYAVSILYPEGRGLNRILGLGIIPGAVYSAIVFMNPLTKNIFNITAAGGYVRGRYIVATYIIFYAYCVASIIITVVNYKKTDRKIRRILAAFPVLAFLVIIVQQMYPNIILSGSAATCALLIIYLHIQNKQISLDYLTNLPNRRELLDMLELILKRSAGEPFTLMVVSLREFRLINNTCGQQRGDKFLQEFGRFLCRFGPVGRVYRFSGDEFAILFTHESDEMIIRCVQAVEERMTKPWQLDDYRLDPEVVIGIIRRSDVDSTLENIINAIEYAVSQAKSGKYGTVCHCDKAMLGKLRRRGEIVRILKDKLADQSFEMYYQPIYSVKEGNFQFAESLMRINESPIGPIYPSEFIPIAEETGLIIDITYVILDKVCKFINRLLEKKIPVGSIHVNFSGVQFSQPDLQEKVLGIIRQNKIPASAIKIEFTESTLADSPQTVTEFAAEMGKYGIKMGLDDFGTGYSNFATVISIPFGTIKIDKSIMWASTGNITSAAAIKHIVNTFKALNMKVVAEGVETEEQVMSAIDAGIDQIQGYYYSRPLSEEDMERFLAENNRRATQVNHHPA